MEGDVTTETNSIEPPRRNSFELGSLPSVNINSNSCETDTKCSNFINAFSINSACKYLLQKKNVFPQLRIRKFKIVIGRRTL